MESSRILFCNNNFAGFLFFSIQLIQISLFRDKNTHKQSFEFIFAFFLVYYGFISFMKFRNDDSQNYLCLDGVLSILCCTSKICWSNLFGQFRSLLNRYKPCGALLIIHSFLLGVSLYWPSIYLFDVKKNAVKSE